MVSENSGFSFMELEPESSYSAKGLLPCRFRGKVGPNRGIVEPNRGLVGPNRGIAGPFRGTGRPFRFWERGRRAGHPSARATGSSAYSATRLPSRAVHPLVTESR